MTHSGHTGKWSQCSRTVEWLIRSTDTLGSTLHPQRGTKSCHLPRHRWPLRTRCWVKGARRRRPQTVGFHLFEMFRIGTSQRQKADERLAGDKGRGQWGATANRYVVSSGEGNVSERGGGDGCTTLRMSKAHSTVHFQMVYFRSCEFKNKKAFLSWEKSLPYLK